MFLVVSGWSNMDDSIFQLKTWFSFDDTAKVLSQKTGFTLSVEDVVQFILDKKLEASWHINNQYLFPLTFQTQVSIPEGKDKNALSALKAYINTADKNQKLQIDRASSQTTHVDIKESFKPNGSPLLKSGLFKIHPSTPLDLILKELFIEKRDYWASLKAEEIIAKTNLYGMDAMQGNAPRINVINTTSNNDLPLYISYSYGLYGFVVQNEIGESFCRVMINESDQTGYPIPTPPPYKELVIRTSDITTFLDEVNISTTKLKPLSGSSVRPERSSKNNQKREEILKAALYVLANFPDQCATKSTKKVSGSKIANIICEKSPLFWPKTGETPFGQEAIARLVNSGLKLNKN